MNVSSPRVHISVRVSVKETRRPTKYRGNAFVSSILHGSRMSGPIECRCCPWTVQSHLHAELLSVCNVGNILKNLKVPMASIYLCCVSAFQKRHSNRTRKPTISPPNSSQRNRVVEPEGINLRNRNRQGLKPPDGTKTGKASFLSGPRVDCHRMIRVTSLDIAKQNEKSSNNPVLGKGERGRVCRIDFVQSVRKERGTAIVDQQKG